MYRGLSEILKIIVGQTIRCIMIGIAITPQLIPTVDPQHSRCTRSFTSMSSFETYRAARTPQVGGPHRYSPSHPAANRSRDPSWMFCGDVRSICPPFSNRCPPIPGQLPVVFSYVDALLLDRAMNLTYLSVPVQEPITGGMGTIQRIYRKRDHLGDTQHG